ncbi:family 2 glycosyl transferase [Erythrobacter sp. SG61-1L]|uniref:glycosyltransferase family A protein n=1 Tax=Erythrobacter sp. SG61-1L TaxID=1603897 RepID=UPI0006C9242B|nr:glycosyltransferase family A protein [Erythrobacter sp. SG61-1L]KPL69520.1 family 2 glycosyl transferase [Erythrobacter sp. SG61-1L]
MPIIVAVMAHNEERRIARCLASLPLGDPGIGVHVVVNGSSDGTAQIARGLAGVTVHEYQQGGKSRSWNRFVFDTPGIAARCYVFVDGDAEVLPGSVEALAATLKENPAANAAAGMPRNGRNAEAYRQQMLADHGLFGDLYALSGSFVERMRASDIRLPEDLVGDDGLLCAMAKTDLANEDDWRNERVVPCVDAGFLCEEASLLRPGTLVVQYRRMINYSLRHFQNRIISAIMRKEGPAGLPRRLAALYSGWLPRLAPRRDPVWWWFDRKALARMARAAVS